MNRQNIGLWIVVGVLLLLDIGVHCVRAQTDSAKLLKTQNLEIMNSKGMDVIDLEISKQGSSIIGLNDPQGNVRMGLLVDKDGGNLNMIDASGKTTLAITGANQPSFSFFSNNEMKGMFGVRNDGWPILALSESEGKDRALLAYDPSGDQSIFQLSDKDNKQIAEMNLTTKYAIVDVTDKTSTRRAALRCTSDGDPLLYVAGKDGQPSWSAPDSSQ
jgi:hypothetical protein